MATNSRKQSKCICPICLEAIVEATSKKQGDDAIECSSFCKTWLHRRCAGLSKVAFVRASQDNAPFCCPRCRIHSFEQELLTIKSDLAVLMSKTSEISTKFDEKLALQSSLFNDLLELLQTKIADLSNKNTESLPQSYADAVHGPRVQTETIQNIDISQARADHDPATTDAHKKSQPTIHVAPKHTSPSRQDRKFNFIIFGIAECPPGTTRKDRAEKDENSVTKAVQKIIPTFSSLSIRDYYRLGKYDSSSVRPRPILVNLSRANDVESVLAHCASPALTSLGICIKPDLTPEQRHNEHLLLYERRLLIDAGTDSKLIKIRKNHLYVGFRRHATVRHGALHRSDSLGDHAQSLEDIANHAQESPMQAFPSPEDTTGPIQEPPLQASATPVNQPTSYTCPSSDISQSQ